MYILPLVSCNLEEHSGGLEIFILGYFSPEEFVEHYFGDITLLFMCNRVVSCFILERLSLIKLLTSYNVSEIINNDKYDLPCPTMP